MGVAKRKWQPTKAQLLLQIHLRELGLETEMEYQFEAGRKWKFDLVDLASKVAFECDGGKWHGGHRRGKALEDDYTRQNTAILKGWQLLRFTNEQVFSGEAKAFVAAALRAPAPLRGEGEHKSEST